MPFFHTHVTLPNLAIHPGDTTPNPGPNRSGSTAYSTLIKRNVVWDGSAWQAEQGNTTFTKPNGESLSLLIGTPVYLGVDGSLHKTMANAPSTTRASGLVFNTSAAPGADCSVLMNGVLQTDVGSWQLVTGDISGLTPGLQYYLDSTAPGKLTTSLPTLTGLYIAPMGVALSTTEFEINIKSAYQL